MVGALRSMNIQIRSNNQSFVCKPDESILDAALRQNIQLPYGCRGGRCGSCIGDLLQGEIAYPNGQPKGISDQEHGEGKVLFCQARAKSDLLIEARVIDVPKGVVVRKMPARVHELKKLAADVIGLKLKIPSNDRLQFLPGQYMDFILDEGRRRSFSLANAPHEDQFLEFHIRHVDGGYFTPLVFAELKKKALLRIEGPLGRFYLRKDSKEPIIMMGGGTGIAPLRSMILQMIATGTNQAIHLFWGVRALKDAYLVDEIGQWLKKCPALKFTLVLSEPEPGDTKQMPVDLGLVESGYVHEALIRTYPDLSAYVVYMSGPPPMIDAARAVFLQQGMVKDKLFSDAFDFADDPKCSAIEKEAKTTVSL